MCTVTATEFKNKLGQYLSLADQEDILIMKNGKPIAKLVSAASNALDNFFKFEGIFDEKTMSFEESRIERMKK